MSSGRKKEQTYWHEIDLHIPEAPRLYIQSKKVPHLQLRLVTPEDAEILLRLFTDQRNVQYDKSCASLDTMAAIEALIQQWSSFTQPIERANLVVVVDGRVIGTGGLGWIGTDPHGRRVGHAGIMLDSEFRGKGYAYEALRIVIDFGLRVLDLDEVQVSTRDANDAMKGLMNVKMGFPASRIHDEKFGNEWAWRITADEWFRSAHCA
jgi:RimJ/RimL family protein N-acetyltransferase